MTYLGFGLWTRKQTIQTLSEFFALANAGAKAKGLKKAAYLHRMALCLVQGFRWYHIPIIGKVINNAAEALGLLKQNQKAKPENAEEELKKLINHMAVRVNKTPDEIRAMATDDIDSYYLAVEKRDVMHSLQRIREQHSPDDLLKDLRKQIRMIEDKAKFQERKTDRLESKLQEIESEQHKLQEVNQTLTRMFSTV